MFLQANENILSDILLCWCLKTAISRLTLQVKGRQLEMLLLWDSSQMHERVRQIWWQLPWAMTGSCVSGPTSCSPGTGGWEKEYIECLLSVRCFTWHPPIVCLFKVLIFCSFHIFLYSFWFLRRFHYEKSIQILTWFFRCPLALALV